MTSWLYLQRWYFFIWWWLSKCSSCCLTLSNRLLYSPLTFHWSCSMLIISDFTLFSLFSTSISILSVPFEPHLLYFSTTLNTHQKTSPMNSLYPDCTATSISSSFSTSHTLQYRSLFSSSILTYSTFSI